MIILRECKSVVFWLMFVSLWIIGCCPCCNEETNDEIEENGIRSKGNEPNSHNNKNGIGVPKIIKNILPNQDTNIIKEQNINSNNINNSTNQQIIQYKPSKNIINKHNNVNTNYDKNNNKNICNLFNQTLDNTSFGERFYKRINKIEEREIFFNKETKKDSQYDKKTYK